MEDLLNLIYLYYPQSDNYSPSTHPESTQEFQNRNALCVNSIENSLLQKKWNSLKSKLLSSFAYYQETSDDVELLLNTPALRFGLKVVDDNEKYIGFSLFISLIKPVYCWYFIEWEKFPKGNHISNKKLGPTESRFIEFNLHDYYNKLCMGEISSITEINISHDVFFKINTPFIRFKAKNQTERYLVEKSVIEIKSIFTEYEYFDPSISNFVIPNLLNHRYKGISCTAFDCLFLGDLSYK